MEKGASAIYLKNMANACQNLHLAAAALGLGAQWVSVDSVWESSLKDILGVPAVLDIHTLAAIGYPAYQQEESYRRKLTEIVHFGKYDRSKYRSGEDVIKFLYYLREQTKLAYSQENLP